MAVTPDSRSASGRAISCCRSLASELMSCATCPRGRDRPHRRGSGADGMARGQRARAPSYDRAHAERRRKRSSRAAAARTLHTTGERTRSSVRAPDLVAALFIGLLGAPGLATTFISGNSCNQPKRGRPDLGSLPEIRGDEAELTNPDGSGEPPRRVSARTEGASLQRSSAGPSANCGKSPTPIATNCPREFWLGSPRGRSATRFCNELNPKRTGQVCVVAPSSLPSTNPTGAHDDMNQGRGDEVHGGTKGTSACRLRNLSSVIPGGRLVRTGLFSMSRSKKRKSNKPRSRRCRSI